ncbi:hypothetical protein FRX31_016172, partial [Thalictrum thalictroides]
MWTTHEDFKDFIKHNWSLTGFSPQPLLALEIKIRNIRAQLKRWNKEVFGNIHKNIQFLEDAITRLEFKLITGWDQQAFI